MNRKHFFYIASRLENADRVTQLNNALVEYGWVCTYDWTVHGAIRHMGANILTKTAHKEYYGVINCDLFICLLPGGRGTHIELGMAIAAAVHHKKRILIWSETHDPFLDGEHTCAFYPHSAVQQLVCPFSELPERIKKVIEA